MVSITVRDIPQGVRDELAARAARSGRSLQEYLAATLADVAARPDLEGALIEIRHRAMGMPAIEAEEILADRAADRR